MQRLMQLIHHTDTPERCDRGSCDRAIPFLLEKEKGRAIGSPTHMTGIRTRLMLLSHQSITNGIATLILV
jgi:hypothetical protein